MTNIMIQTTVHEKEDAMKLPEDTWGTIKKTSRYTGHSMETKMESMQLRTKNR